MEPELRTEQDLRAEQDLEYEAGLRADRQRREDQEQAELAQALAESVREQERAARAARERRLAEQEARAQALGRELLAEAGPVRVRLVREDRTLAFRLGADRELASLLPMFPGAASLRATPEVSRLVAGGPAPARTRGRLGELVGQHASLLVEARAPAYLVYQDLLDELD